MTYTACCTTRSRFVAGWLGFLLSGLSFAFSHAQSGTQVYSRLEAATRSSSLIYADKPWHLKLDVQLLDNQGLVSQQGTIERWQSGDDTRTTSNFGASSSVWVEQNGHSYREVQGQGLPATAQTLLDALIHPGPYPEQTAGTSPDLRPTNFGKQRMDCIMLTRPLGASGTIPLGVFPSYCLDNSDRIAIIAQGGTDLVLQNQVGKFLGFNVGTALTLMRGERIIGRAKVTQLNTFSPRPNEFDPGVELAASELSVRMSGAMMQGAKLSGPPPTYPEAARSQRITGTVVLNALIGADGHLESLVPVSGPDISLVLSALQAVRDWTYKPYMLNGVPVSVKTTITINYHLR